MADRGPRWLVADLNADHDRSGFSCGHESLDAFIRRYAGQNQRTGVSRTYVAVRPARTAVLGYYAIAAGSVHFANLPAALRRRLPRYPVPVGHLGRLAVDVSAQGEGLGEHLLIDALARIEVASESIGIHAVEVVAIDEAARRFYVKYGFVPLHDDPRHLYMSIETVRRLRLD